MQRGYTIIHLNQPPRQQFGMPLMDMPYVPLKGLLLDVRDADALKAGTLGCPPPEVRSYLHGGSCCCLHIFTHLNPVSCANELVWYGVMVSSCVITLHQLSVCSVSPCS